MTLVWAYYMQTCGVLANTCLQSVCCFCSNVKTNYRIWIQFNLIQWIIQLVTLQEWRVVSLFYPSVERPVTYFSCVGYCYNHVLKWSIDWNLIIALFKSLLHTSLIISLTVFFTHYKCEICSGSEVNPNQLVSGFIQNIYKDVCSDSQHHSQ